MSRLRPAVGLVGLLVLLVAVVVSTVPSPAPAAGTPRTSAPVVATTQARAPYGRATGVSLAPLIGPTPQPNIVVIMTDDARDGDLQFMPNVRRLIGDRGVRFTNAFSPQPLCCPARASFLSGQYSHNHGVWSNRSPYGFQAFHDRPIVARWLHAAGYDTNFVGKYLNGYGTQPLPDGSPSLRYVPPGWTDWRGAVQSGYQAGRQLKGGTYAYFNTTLNLNGRLKANHGVYQTDLVTGIGNQMIESSSQSPRPSFTWLSYITPHEGRPVEKDDPAPAVRTDDRIQRFLSAARPRSVWGRFDQRLQRIPGYRGEADVSDKPYFIRAQPPLTDREKEKVLEIDRQRAEALSVLDDQVGTLLGSLRRAGELPDTYVVFTSDNGYFLGEHRRRQGKNLPYEPALRVPLLIRGPGIPAGERRTDPFLTPDFAPTFLQMAGAPVPARVDGVSMLDVARHGDQGWRRGVLVETGPRRGPKNIRLLDRPEGPSTKRFTQGVRTPRYLYVEHASRERELYDLRRDPREVHSLVDDQAEQGLVRRLAAMLQRLRACAGHQCARPLPPSLQADRPVPRIPPGRGD